MTGEGPLEAALCPGRPLIQINPSRRNGTYPADLPYRRAGLPIAVPGGRWSLVGTRHHVPRGFSSMASKPLASDLQIITRIAVFRGLKPETVEHIIAPATAAMHRAQECIFRQGDPATAFFITISGWVKLYRITQAGEETVIHTMTKGDSFAEAVAFTGNRYPLRPRP